VLVTDPNDPAARPGGDKSQWVLGDVSNPVHDPDLMRNGLLFPYVGDLGVYKCPADLKTVVGVPTLRSVSMNAWMNPFNTENQLYPDYIMFRTQADIRKPAGTWLLIDENSNSINDGWFVARPNTPTVWRDIPAAYHQGGAGISYADMHVEMKRWTDLSVLNQRLSYSRRDPYSNDLGWLLERTTYPR
jgi:hypothetical protein